jgi:hypothetical protein
LGAVNFLGLAKFFAWQVVATLPLNTLPPTILPFRGKIAAYYHFSISFWHITVSEQVCSVLLSKQEIAAVS